jgi:hypothetical protein
MMDFGICDTKPSGSTASASYPFFLLVGRFNNNCNCALSIPSKRKLSCIYKLQQFSNCATEALFLPQLFADSVSALLPDSPPHP